MIGRQEKTKMQARRKESCLPIKSELAVEAQHKGGRAMGNK